MCYGCWEDLGKPQLRNDRVEHAVELIARVYAGNRVGGNLHVQIDDWNLDDEYFEDEQLPIFNPESDLDADRECYAALREMTLEERASALALHDGFE